MLGNGCTRDMIHFRICYYNQMCRHRIYQCLGTLSSWRLYLFSVCTCCYSKRLILLVVCRRQVSTSVPAIMIYLLTFQSGLFGRKVIFEISIEILLLIVLWDLLLKCTEYEIFLRLHGRKCLIILDLLVNRVIYLIDSNMYQLSYRLTS